MLFCNIYIRVFSLFNRENVWLFRNQPPMNATREWLDAEEKIYHPLLSFFILSSPLLAAA